DSQRDADQDLREGKGQAVQMKFEEVAASLPNGLHDAELQRLEMHYVQRKLQFDLVVWVGDMDDSRNREAYRPAQLTFDDVAFLVIEPPDRASLLLNGRPIRIDAGHGQPPQSSTTLPDLPSGRSITWMYLEQVNAFLLFSAGQVSLTWTGPR